MCGAGETGDGCVAPCCLDVVSCFPLQTVSMYSSYAYVGVVAFVAGWDLHWSVVQALFPLAHSMRFSRRYECVADQISCAAASTQALAINESDFWRESEIWIPIRRCTCVSCHVRRQTDVSQLATLRLQICSCRAGCTVLVRNLFQRQVGLTWTVRCWVIRRGGQTWVVNREFSCAATPPA